MVKSTIILFSVLALIIAASYFENRYVNSKIEEFKEELATVIENTKNEDNSSEKLKDILKWWKDTKHILHAFIPHDDIRDVDGLIVQSLTLIQKGEYSLALTQLEKLNYTIMGIPENFHFNFGNIF